MKKNFRVLFEKAGKRGPRRFAVAGAAGEEVLRAVSRAGKMGLMRPILIGPENRIRKIAEELKISLRGMELIGAGEDAEIADRAARLVSEGNADAIMKGDISTPVVLKSVLDPKYALRSSGRLLSHIAYMDVPSFPKMFVITDSGMVIRPALEQKVEILRNAIGFVRKLGVRRPKIAVLAANEKVSPHMPETADGVELARLAREGLFGNVILEGPMALDMAFSKESARIKKVRSRVAGSPDILLVPDIASGNIFAKGLVYLAGAKISGLIVGAKIPIVLISRAEKAETWLRSIALANIVS
jgi:phosphate butyryltransferase